MSKKILIVEDEKPMAKALELKLNNSGFEVRAVFDGEEALNSLISEKFDLVLMDLIMPKMDGFAVLEALKKENNKTPVVILSNLSQENDEKRVRELGAVDFFIKSNTPLIEILKYVQKILK